MQRQKRLGVKRISLQLALGITLPITIKSDYKLKAPVTTHTTLG